MAQADSSHTSSATHANIIPFRKRPESSTDVSPERHEPHPIFSCSFVRKVSVPGRKRLKRWCFWCVEPSGDYCSDYDRGVNMALEFMEAHGRRQSYGTFGGWVFADMSRADQRAHHGLVSGFANTLVRFSQTFWSVEYLGKYQELNRLEREAEARMLADLPKRSGRRRNARSHRSFPTK